MDEDAVWELERRFWTDGLSTYREFLDPACLMVFPGIGIMAAGAILDSLADAPRWSSVEMTDRQIGSTDNALVLGYTAEGRREDAEPYWCRCTSTYRKAEAGWKLIQHQQTLADQPGVNRS